MRLPEPENPTPQPSDTAYGCFWLFAFMLLVPSFLALLFRVLSLMAAEWIALMSVINHA